MPYPGVPESKWPKMERCVSKIKGKYTKSQKIAICHSRIMGEQTIADMKKGGVPDFEARARWAASFWRKHGLFPHQIFEGEDFGYDIPTAGLLATETIIDIEVPNTNNHKVKSMVHGSDIRFQEITLPLVAFDIGDDNTLTIIASKDGAKAYLHTGTAVTWKDGVLGKIAETWKGGRVGANHEPDINEGNILISRYEKPFLYQTVKMSDELKGNVERNKGFVGVSIEATDVHLDEKEQLILDAKGTGVTFVFYPKKPACNEDDGCGIVGADPEKEPDAPADQTDEDKINDSDTEGEKMSENDEKNASAEEASEIESLKTQIAEISAERDELKQFKLEILNERKSKILEDIRKMTATDEEDGLCAMDFEQLTAFHDNLQAAKVKAEEEETEDSGAVGTEPTQEDEPESDEVKLKAELDEMQKIELSMSGANVHGKVIDLTGELPVEEPEEGDEEKKKKEGES